MESEIESVTALWSQEQLTMKSKLIISNTEPWQTDRKLNLVGGMDISFCKTDSSIAICTLVVCSVSQQLKVVYEDSLHVKLSTPYIPGFLAFREFEPCLNLYTKLTSKHPKLIPQVLMFDGNGILHPRGLGLASHFGVCTNTCTIGVAKNLYQMGSILRDENHFSQINSLSAPGDHFFIKNSAGNGGEILGAALKTTQEAKRPVYISIGHRIGLETAIWAVMQCINRYRIPEPTRQADIRSRHLVRKLEESKNKNVDQYPPKISFH
ncbi:endonuclease V-like [Daphnia pulicaria]|uniref:endonuclease V-like n=1 Tax=Daphnia pulicaria TaxID=35523 RepID=UPI001EEC810E|nr:endonuclease V-like [Daphnia pulicaria]